MLFNQLFTMIIFLSMLIPCFGPHQSIAYGSEEITKFISSSADNVELPGYPKRNGVNLESPKMSEEDKHKPEAVIHTERREMRSNKENGGFIEWAQNILVFAQFILVVSCIVGVLAMGYYSISIILNTKKEVDKKIGDIEKGIEDKVDFF